MDKRYKENDRFDNEEGGSLDRYNCRADAVSMNVYIPYSVSFLVEVLGETATGEAYGFLRVYLDHKTFLSIVFMLMLPILSYLVTTVLADSHCLASGFWENIGAIA